MRTIASFATVLVSGALFLGCSGSDLPPQSGVGGSPSGTGGASSVTPSGGVTSVTSTGGNTNALPSSGGADATGGTSGLGGNNATGGSIAATGGSKATGGSSMFGATGGTKATGGSNAAGGSSPAGGSSATTGGNKTTGGSNATGGAIATTGGSKATGGANATGGTSAVAGSSAIAVKCDNLRATPSTAGVAKPSGAAGGLKVLDWAGFTGAVSFTFDDNNSSQISNYSQLQATGAKVTFFMVSGWTSASNAVWKTAVTDGHEIANHTKSHQSAASLTDLQAAEDWIKSNLGVTAYTMAAPNGDASWASVAPQLLIANRGVANGLVGPRDSSNVFSLPAYIPPTGANAATMDGEVNAAKTANKWKIFCVHGFTGDSAAYQPVDLTGMTTTMSNAVKNGLWADTITNVGAYYQGQKAIPASATTSATWTLPAHFPPNMCVRVTTTGGTVKQNGVEVPWNSHGYYEISLDAKSVTVQ